ncbi:hypothetical protein GCM10010104_56350 [Streptomyces indiaensis]|uniref:Uncharacterized protein n=1 Tax=Streptomyces indiaensis TaxID=284033 RepID=A0ABN3E9N8_9ACTN
MHHARPHDFPGRVAEELKRGTPMPSSAGHHSPTLNRRGFLRTSLGGSAALVAAPAFVGWLGAADAKAATAPAAFVDDYKTNLLTNQTPETNAVVRALGGFAEMWKTGDWNTGTPLMPEILRANVRYCERITAGRTDAEAKQAFVIDRQHQSYSMIEGLGPLAALYTSGAKAVTSITCAPEGTPPAKVNDAVPAGAPAGSALGAGSSTPNSARWHGWWTPCAATGPPATRPSSPTSTRAPGG